VLSLIINNRIRIYTRRQESAPAFSLFFESIGIRLHAAGTDGNPQTVKFPGFSLAAGLTGTIRLSA
jgi:hypothetical protein